MRRNFRHQSLLGILFSILFLAACGGDDTPDNPVDPDVMSVGGTAQGIMGSIVLQNNAGDDLTVIESGNFAFATELEEGDAYAVTIKTGPIVNRNCELENATGTMMDTAVTDVTVTCTPFWGGPNDLTTDANVQDLSLAFDINGNAMAVWVEAAAIVAARGLATTNLHATYFDVRTATWGDSEIIESLSTNPENPDVVFDADGNAIVVWQQYPDIVITASAAPLPDQAYEIRSARYNAATGVWGSDETINTSDRHAKLPKIAVDLDGNVMVVWYEEYAGVLLTEELALIAPSPLIRAARYDATSGKWETDEGINNSASTMENARNPKIAFDQNGNAIAVWEQAQEAILRTSSSGSLLKVSVSDIRAARYSEGTWGNEQVIDTGTSHAYSSEISMDADGNAFVVFAQAPDIVITGATNGLAAVSSSDTQATFFDVSTKAWQTPVVLDSGSESVMTPDVAFDLDGNAIAVWGQLDGLSRYVWAARFSESVWGTALVISANTEGLNTQLMQVGMDIEGNSIATWAQYVVPSEPSIMALTPMEGMWSKYSDGTWNAPESISDGANVYDEMTTVVSPYGGAISMWVSSDPYDAVVNIYGP